MRESGRNQKVFAARREAEKNVRARFSHHPSREELRQADETEPAGVLGNVFLCMEVVAGLKEERRRQRLSLRVIEERSGLDRPSLSRLENGHNSNPTLETLCRYAASLGKSLSFTFHEDPNGAEKKKVKVTKAGPGFSQKSARKLINR